MFDKAKTGVQTFLLPGKSYVESGFNSYSSVFVSKGWRPLSKTCRTAPHYLILGQQSFPHPHAPLKTQAQSYPEES